MLDVRWENLQAATMAGDGYGLLPDAAIGLRDGLVAYAGPRGGAPAARVVEDAGGLLATPGLVDCHTHLVYGGNRAAEFEQRLQGRTYAAIAEAGGGIQATMRATSTLDEDALVAEALPRLDAMLAEGVTTVEVKSGYGWDTAAELRCLRAARRLGTLRDVSVQTTFLGLHAAPGGDAEAHTDRVIRETLPAVHAEGLADAVDAFCETIAFSTGQVRRYFEAAQALGLPLKLHAEQLSNQGGAAVLAEHGGLSADHLEYLDEAGVRAMAGSGAVAVLLPGAYYVLREKQAPPVGLLRQHGVPMAVATDCNPGSSPMVSPLLAMNMACTLFRLTPIEALRGFTVHAARALGLRDRGTLAVGQRADFALWRVAHPAELAYAMGHNRCAGVVRGGTRRDP